jgi:hypothetical protein
MSSWGKMMQRALRIVRQARDKVASHAFFEWLHAAPVPLVDKLAFSPVMADFIMGFADLNKWFLAYAEPEGELERSINEHASEDQTHSRLFAHEWRKLGLDERLGWSAGDTLWWWFWCRETEVVRRAAMETLGLAERNPDPLVRFAMIEAIETCGDVFFSNTCPIAVALERETGVRFDYYGVHHRALEDGHLRCDERAFVEARLEPHQHEQAVRAATRIFELFEEELDQLLDYVQRLTHDPQAVVAALRAERASQRVTGPRGSSGRAPAGASQGAEVPSVAVRAVTQQLGARLARLQGHRFVRWLASSRAWTEDRTAVEMLRGLAPLWAIDVLGYKDFNRYVLCFATPRDAEERAINRWAERLASHGVLYLQDWEALGLDRDLGWGACQTIEHYFLGERSAVHRYAMARVKKRAFASDSPRLRYWLMRALEEGGQVLFDALAPWVAAAEATLETDLSYWASRHHLAEPEQPRDPEAERVWLGLLPLCEDERRSALETIDVIFDNFERLFELSMCAVEERLETTGSVRGPATVPQVAECIA